MIIGDDGQEALRQEKMDKILLNRKMKIKNSIISNAFNNERGLSTAESGILLSVLIAGIIAMSLYLQRGMQGGMFQSTQSIGMQFDPRNSYSERKTYDMSQGSTEGGGTTLTSAHLSSGITVETGPFSGEHTWVLINLSNTEIPREPTGWTTSEGHSSSSSTREGAYHVEH
jgi:hypothetical protein